MGRARTYGARKKHTSAAATAIFGNDAPKSPVSPERAVLADITSAFNNIDLNATKGDDIDNDDQNREYDLFVPEEAVEETEEVIYENELNRVSQYNSKVSLATNWRAGSIKFEEHQDEDGEVSEQDTGDITLDPKYTHLLPLINAYKTDTGQVLTCHSWADMLPETCTVVKIAEASYAEVYRITVPTGETSIIKMMRIQSPHDPSSSESVCDTAIQVQNIISEVRIMNALTELPGFVRFKDAQIIRGRSVPAFIEAYEQREAQPKVKQSFFPHPEEYTEESEFLAIELGDAGCVLEEFPVKNIEQVWDIFLGTVLALAKGEMANEFEHRDLHENNICISTTTSTLPSNSPTKLGHAGIKVTLIDYGLSRATLAHNTTVYLDLETDPSLFQGSEGHPQFNAYRRMRTHLITGEHISKSRSWHEDSHPEQSWETYMPYSNVVWIGYMLGYLKKVYRKGMGRGKGQMKAWGAFVEETVELGRR
ncbi:putative serine/threonine-protein kinase haspin-like protein, partial [Lachnellula suecica]